MHLQSPPGTFSFFFLAGGEGVEGGEGCNSSSSVKHSTLVYFFWDTNILDKFELPGNAEQICRAKFRFFDIITRKKIDYFPLFFIVSRTLLASEIYTTGEQGSLGLNRSIIYRTRPFSSLDRSIGSYIVVKVLGYHFSIQNWIQRGKDWEEKKNKEKEQTK